MKDDQIVRIVVAVCLVVGYFIHVKVNGGGAIDVFGYGVLQPFTFVAILELVLAFPELLESVPFGPTREN